MRQVTVNGEVKTQGLVSLVINYQMEMVEIATAYGIDDNGKFRPDMSTISVKQVVFSELMKDRPDWAKAKPKNSFRESDLFAILDAGYVKNGVR